MKHNIEVSTTESLILAQALSYMSLDENVNEIDRKIAYSLHERIKDTVGADLKE